MSNVPQPLQDIFAANDSADDLRATVVKYRQGLGSGDGTGSGMEARVAKLEANVEYIQRDIGELRQDSRELKGDMREVRERLARLEEKVSHLPGKGFIVTALIVSLTVVAGLVTFQSNIQSLVGNRPAAGPSAPVGK